MEIKVRLYDTMKRFKQGENTVFSVALDPDSCVKNLLEKLNIPPATECVILVNGRRADENALLCAKDEVVFFSPVAGG